jgi:type IV pilus assembly protein PilV
MRNQSGFTLIEVLIAVVVLASGLLGLAAIQATALGNNHSAYNRSQATQLAYDIADRMRANSNAAANYLGLASAASCATNDTPCTACKTIANACTPQQMAEQDRYDWNQNIGRSLPDGEGFISRSGNVYTIRVSWDDDKNTSTAKLDFLVHFRL